MKVRLRGRAHVVGDCVGELTLIGPHAADWRPRDISRLLAEVPQRLGMRSAAWEAGDILVAGRAFGAETRTDWPAFLLALHGFGAVLCESVLPWMQESCHHAGLPVLVLPGLRAQIRDGDDLILNLEAGTIEDVTHHRMLMTTPLSPTDLRLCRDAPTRRLLGVWEARTDPDVAYESTTPGSPSGAAGA